MISIDQYAYINSLKDVHPIEKFSFSIFSSILCLFTSSPHLHLIIILTMGLVTVGLGKIPYRFYLKMLLISLVFIGVSSIGVALSFTKNPNIIPYGFQVGSWTIGFSSVGLRDASLLFFRAYGSISCLYFLALTTPMVDIIWVLKKVKVPSIITELMIIIYRFIFVLLETTSMIFISQDSRLGYSSIRRSYSSLGGLVSNLFLKSFFRSKELFTALTARGYTGDFNVLEESKTISYRNMFFIGIIEISFIVLAFLL